MEQPLLKWKQAQKILQLKFVIQKLLLAVCLFPLPGIILYLHDVHISTSATLIGAK